eukprot:gene18550-23609_t
MTFGIVQTLYPGLCGDGVRSAAAITAAKRGREGGGFGLGGATTTFAASSRPHAARRPAGAWRRVLDAGDAAGDVLLHTLFDPGDPRSCASPGTRYDAGGLAAELAAASVGDAALPPAIAAALPTKPSP